MKTLPQRGSAESVPALARILLSELIRLRSTDLISDANFEEKVRRIEREELRRCGFLLSRREFPGGRTSFQIKSEATGLVCETVGEGS